MHDERLTITEVATVYRIPVATLRYWRARGEGPRSFRLGRRVFYRKQDCDAWVDAALADIRHRSSTTTSEWPGQGHEQRPRSA